MNPDHTERRLLIAATITITVVIATLAATGKL